MLILSSPGAHAPAHRLGLHLTSGCLLLVTDLAAQLEFGPTRFLLAGGASYGIEPWGLALTLGTQQLLAAGQDPRLAVGLSWTP